MGLFDEGDSPSLRTSFQLGVESVADNRHLLSKSHLAAVVTSSSSSSPFGMEEEDELGRDAHETLGMHNKGEWISPLKVSIF